MKKLISFSLAVFLIAITLTACKQEETKKGDLTDPEFRIEYVSGEKQIAITVTIPRDHHAYLDSGKENNLIPIQFQWKELVQNNILTQEPELVAKPEGVYDKTFEATVLRDSGVFVFRFSDDLQKLKNQTLNIRVQMCNDVTGICYRPKTYKISL